MLETHRINTMRILAGGSVAGLLMFIAAGIVNGAILGNAVKDWMQGMAGHIHPMTQGASFALWLMMNIIHGIAGVGLYALIQTRFTSRTQAALLAGLLLWIVSKLAIALDLIAVGIFPVWFIAAQLSGSFIASILGVFIGSKFYEIGGAS